MIGRLQWNPPRAQFSSWQNDLRYLFFLHRSLFNLHLKKQYSIFHLVASWCCDSFPVALWVAPFALFPVFTLAFPSQPFPGSLLLGSAWIKNGHKKATMSKYWLGLRTVVLSQRWHRTPERPLLFHSYSAAHSRLFSYAETERRRRRRERWKWRVCVCYLRWGRGFLRRNLRIRGQRLQQGNSVQAAASQGGVRISVSTLRKYQSQKASKRAEQMWFPAPGASETVNKLSTRGILSEVYLPFYYRVQKH